MTDGKNRTLIWIVVICILAVGFLGGLYGNAYNELSSARSEIQDIQQRYSAVNVSLSKALMDVALAENFSLNYFSTWSQFFQTKEIEDRAWLNYNKANGYYTEGNWFNAVGYFGEAAVYFRAARDQYSDVSYLFSQVSNSTMNTTISEVCVGYENMMLCMMRAMTFMAEASDILESACDYYLEGDYPAAHSQNSAADNKISYYQDQLLLYDEYLKSVETLLKDFA